MQQKKFSVVIPIFNKENYITQCLSSVIQQSFAPDEIILINDGSTDSSMHVAIQALSKYDGKYRIVNKKNSGVSAARNSGLQLAKNQWVAFIDADDLWSADHLLYLSFLIDTFNDGIIYSSSFRTFSSGISDVKFLREKKLILGRNVWQGYFSSPNRRKYDINSSSVCVSREALISIGGFSDFKYGEDIECWVRMCLLGKSYMHSFATSFYRIEVPNSLSNNLIRRQFDVGSYSTAPALLFLDNYIEHNKFDPSNSEKIEEIKGYIKYRLFIGMKIKIRSGVLGAMRAYSKKAIYRKYGPSIGEFIGFTVKQLVSRGYYKLFERK